MLNNFYKEDWVSTAIVENMADPMVIADIDETIVYVNNSFIKLSRYNKKELIGQKIFILHSDEEAAIQKRGIYDIIFEGKIWEGELDLKQKDGEFLKVNLIIHPLKNEKGEIEGFFGIYNDLTEIKEVEKRVKKATDELQRSNEELEQFAYVSSHDMQEPLRVVSSYCQLIKEKNYKCMDDEGKKYLDYSIDATFRMKTLIKELLDFSRVGRKDSPFEKVDLNNLVAVVLKDFEEAVKETGVNIIIENSMPTVLGIRFRLKQLLHNLISNSIKFRGKINPEIRIGCCEESSDIHWLFYVRDNGLGINPEYYDRIFGIFKRLYSREEYPGTGIGLALCKRIAEAHGGKIWVESNPDESTYFYFTILKNKYFC